MSTKATRQGRVFLPFCFFLLPFILIYTLFRHIYSDRCRFPCRCTLYVFSPQHPRRRANIIIIFSFWLNLSHFPQNRTPHTNSMVYIITYMHTVNITVLRSCRVLASMYTHYNTQYCVVGLI